MPDKLPHAGQGWCLENVVVPVARWKGVGPEYEYLSPSIQQFPTGAEQEELALAAGFAKVRSSRKLQYGDWDGHALQGMCHLHSKAGGKLAGVYDNQVAEYTSFLLIVLYLSLCHFHVGSADHRIADHQASTAI